MTETSNSGPADARPPPLFPVFLRLRGRRVLVVGAGSVAARKVRALVEAGAVVTVVAPAACDELASAAAGGGIEWIRNRFENLEEDLGRQGFLVVIAAAGPREINRRVHEWARRHGVLCNVVDDPDLCDFYVPARLHRGDIQVAVSTSGAAPGLAAFLRDRLADRLPETPIRHLLAEAIAARQRIREQTTDPEKRRQMFREHLDRLWLREFGRDGKTGDLPPGDGHRRKS